MIRVAQVRFLADSFGHLSWVCPNLCEVLGCPRVNLLALGWSRFVILEDFQRVLACWWDAYYHRERYEVRTRLLGCQGSWLDAVVMADPLYEENGSFSGYAGGGLVWPDPRRPLVSCRPQ